MWLHLLRVQSAEHENTQSECERVATVGMLLLV